MSEDAEKKAKPSFMPRWFGGGAAGPAESEAPAAAEPEQTPAEIFEPAPATPAPEPKRTWFQRLKAGLSLSSTSIGRGVTDIFTKRKLDADSLDDLEDILIQAVIDRKNDGVDVRVNRKTTVTGYFGYTQGLAVMEQIYPNGKNGAFGYLEFLYRL